MSAHSWQGPHRPTHYGDPDNSRGELFWCSECGRMTTASRHPLDPTLAARAFAALSRACCAWERTITAPTRTLRARAEKLLERLGGRRPTYTPGCPPCEGKSEPWVCAACCWIHRCPNCEPRR